MVTKAAYAAAGGHAAEPAHIVDDVELARSVKASGHRIALCNGTELVHTRWYTGFREIWNGFSKNVYGGIGYRPGIGLLTLFVVVPALLIPFLRLGAGLTTGGVAFPAAQVALILSMRAVASRVGRDPMVPSRCTRSRSPCGPECSPGRWCSPTPGADRVEGP